MSDSSEKKPGGQPAAERPAKDAQSVPAEKAGKAAAEKKTAPRRPSHGRSHARGASRSTAGLLLALLAFNVALALGGFYLWQQQNATTDEARERIARLKDDELRLARQLEDTRRALEARIGDLQASQKGLRDDLAALLERSGHLRNDWMIAEAEYLIRLANHRLLLDRDVDTALAALATADERLRDTGDPALIPARKGLADDMAALRALPRVDRTGLSLQLSALVREVGKLPLATPAAERAATPAPNEAAAVEPATVAEDQPWWHHITGAWEILRGLIVIRQHDAPVQPLIPPAQRFFLGNNLVLQLEQARIALLRGEQSIYRERVQQAHAWVARYFDKSDAAVADVLAQLQSLAGKDIAPPLPEITRGLSAIARYRALQAGSPPGVTAPKSPAPKPPAPRGTPKPSPKSPAKPLPEVKPSAAPAEAGPPGPPAGDGGGS